jgi:hypothetical protein
MAERKPFLLRIDAGLHAALARWADEESRSLNGQIESLLRRAVEADGRLPTYPGRKPREAWREPVSPTPARSRVPKRPSAPVSGPDAGDRVPRRLSKPVSPPPSGNRAPIPRQPSGSVVPTPPVPQTAAQKPAAASPPARIPVESWDAMED